MNIQIKNRWSASMIHEGDYPSIYHAMADALKVGKSLRGANLCDANLCGANLRYADLCGADLRDADLRGAKNAELAIAKTRHLPEGTIIGWKKAHSKNFESYVLVRLEIPMHAKRSHAFGRKCRASEAKVLAILNEDGSEHSHNEAFSDYSNDFKYVIGETVKPVDPFDEDWAQECASGIHFFITKEEALEYSL